MDIPTLAKCPGYNLYIDGFIALRRTKALKNCNITHIVSVLDWRFDDDTPLIRGYQHLHIPVDDVDDENLLTWFPRSNAFIHDGLNYWHTRQQASSEASSANARHDLGEANQGSGVLIHCAMGKSRSATVLLAYLLWISRQPQSLEQSQQPLHDSAVPPDMVPLPPKPLSVVDALTLLRQGRPIAEPNEGFMSQLYLYADMNCPTTQKELESHKLYRRWMNRRNVKESLRINRAPEMDDILFEDEDDDHSTSDPAATAEQPVPLDTSASQVDISPAIDISAPQGTWSAHARVNSLASDPSTPEIQVKCRKCRRLLAQSAFIIPHTPPGHRDPSVVSDEPCAHVFLHPLSWMKPALAEGQLDGRLTCPNPRCGANVGKFAWQGLRCSCGGWVTPGFGVARSKVDEVRVDGGAGVRGRGIDVAGPGAVRLPPGMRKGMNGNL